MTQTLFKSSRRQANIWKGDVQSSHAGKDYQLTLYQSVKMSFWSKRKLEETAKQTKTLFLSLHCLIFNSPTNYSTLEASFYDPMIWMADSLLFETLFAIWLRDRILILKYGKVVLHLVRSAENCFSPACHWKTTFGFENLRRGVGRHCGWGIMLQEGQQRDKVS